MHSSSIIFFLTLLATLIPQAHAKTFREIENQYVIYRCNRAKKKLHPKCKSIIKEYQKLKKAKEDAPKRAKVCKDDSYSKCYEGVKWGDSAKSFGISVEPSRMYPLIADDFSRCDNFLRTNFISDDWDEYRFSKHKSIVFKELLVGRYKVWQKQSEDAAYLIASKFKKKYGKIKPKVCKRNKHTKTYHWKNTKNGFDVLLLINDSPHTNYKNTVFARYIKTKSLLSIKNKDAKNKAKLKDQADESLRDLGDDI